MTAITTPNSLKHSTIGDLLHALGDVPPERVLLHPAPGTATEQDVLRLLDQEKRLCELVHGTLVEKPVGMLESLVAAALIRIIGNYVESKNLGVVSAPDGPYRLRSGLVRYPDVAFIPWDRLPADLQTLEPIPSIVPALAIEVLSESSTPREIALKRAEYFKAGVRLVWVIEPQTRITEVFTAPDRTDRIVHGGEALHGGDILPGFSLTIDAVFAKLSPAKPSPPAGQNE